jgi:hypothetical protein
MDDPVIIGGFSLYSQGKTWRAGARTFKGKNKKSCSGNWFLNGYR